jgi:hypothetical protein
VADSGSGAASAAGSDSASASASAERTFRSGAGLCCGVLLLALGLWLGGDAVIRGEGRTPWLALAGMLLGTPLVIACTLRPAVFAGEERVRVRNPFRMISAPWGAVEGVRSGYSTELLAGGRKYQIWAIPVSLRARRRAAGQNGRAAQARDPFMRGGRIASASASAGPARAWTDQAVDDLRELAERNGDRESAQGEVVVRWAYEVIAPAAAGAVVAGILLAIG